MKPFNPIILALDYADLQEARQMLSQVRPHIGMIKIGLELFTACGKNSLELAKEFGIPVFLDLKLNDVSTTVKKTVEVICSQLSKYSGEHFLSIHLNGGVEMCYTAYNTVQGSNISVVGITVLTSLDESDFRKLGFSDRRPGIRTIDMAYVGADCLHDKYKYDPNGKRILKGITHFVCAPTQLPLMRQHFGNDIVIITPGIRNEGDEDHDHARTKPASFALKNGASWIVIGRPITKSADPASVAKHFEDQVKKYY